jgi:hypothetical protein
MPLNWAGPPRSLDDWASGGAEVLASDFREGYETLAQYVWEMVFPEIPGP